MKQNSSSRVIDLRLAYAYDKEEIAAGVQALDVLTGITTLYKSTFKTNQRFLEVVKQGKEDAGCGEISDEDLRREDFKNTLPGHVISKPGTRSGEAIKAIHSALVKAGYRKDYWTALYTLEGIPLNIKGFKL
jgi:hypothetical protein